MARLPRPPISIEAKCRVVLRQLGEMWPDDVIRANRFVPRVTSPRSLGRLHADLMMRLASLLKCEISDLQLDHDPALENREKFIKVPGRAVNIWAVVVPKGGVVLGYRPEASDPEHLIYRPKQPEAEGSHKIKTYVRGDRGQLSDAALARKEKRRVKRLDKGKSPGRTRAIPRRVNYRWPSRKFPKGRGFRKPEKRR